PRCRIMRRVGNGVNGQKKRRMTRRFSTKSHRSELNRRPLDYESSALPLSYCGHVVMLIMPWRGLEPRRLAAPPPQDGVSTNFTTRAQPGTTNQSHTANACYRADTASPVVDYMNIAI